MVAPICTYQPRKYIWPAIRDSQLTRQWLTNKITCLWSNTWSLASIIIYNIAYSFILSTLYRVLYLNINTMSKYLNFKWHLSENHLKHVIVGSNDKPCSWSNLRPSKIKKELRHGEREIKRLSVGRVKAKPRDPNGMLAGRKWNQEIWYYRCFNGHTIYSS